MMVQVAPRPGRFAWTTQARVFATFFPIGPSGLGGLGNNNITSKSRLTARRVTMRAARNVGVSDLAVPARSVGPANVSSDLADQVAFPAWTSGSFLSAVVCGGRRAARNQSANNFAKGIRRHGR